MATQPPASFETTAIDKVFATYELLEQILAHLGSLSDLIAAQRTSRAFYNLINRSSRIPGPGVDCYYLDTSIIHRTRIAAPFKKPLALPGFIPTSPSSAASVVPKDTGFPKRIKLEYRNSTSSCSSSQQTTASLLYRLPLCNTPVQVRIWLAADSGGGVGGLRKSDTVLEPGATIGDMFEWLKSELERTRAGKV